MQQCKHGIIFGAEIRTGIYLIFALYFHLEIYQTTDAGTIPYNNGCYLKTSKLFYTSIEFHLQKSWTFSHGYWFQNMQTLGMHNGIQPASSVEGRKSDDDYFWGLDAFPRPFLFLKCDELDLLCFETLSNCKTEKRDGHSSQNQLKSSRRDYGMYVVCPPPPQRV